MNKRRQMLLQAQTTKTTQSKKRQSVSRPNSKPRATTTITATAEVAMVVQHLESKTTQGTAMEAETQESYLAKRRKEQDHQNRVLAEKMKRTQLMKEMVQMAKPARWLTMEAQDGTAATGLDQSELEKRGKQLTLILRDILGHLYSLQNCNRTNKVAEVKAQSKNLQSQEDRFFVWQKALDQANTLYYQLPQETQTLAKQVSIIVTSLSSLPSSLYLAALTSLDCFLESEPEALPGLLNDLIDAFSETIAKLIGHGINVIKMGKSGGSDSNHLRKKSLFRSTSQINYFTYVFLKIGQSQLLSVSPGDFCQLLTNLIFEKALRAASEDETSYMALLSVVANDLALLIHEVNLETPLALKLAKNVALQTMHLLCIANSPEIATATQNEDYQQLDQGTKTALIDATSAVLLGCIEAEISIKEARNMTECYCRSSRATKKEQMLITCSGGCKRQVFHACCVSLPVATAFSAPQSQCDWLCASCEMDPAALLTQILDFYRQFQSNYCDFTGAASFITLLRNEYKKSKSMEGSASEECEDDGYGSDSSDGYGKQLQMGQAAASGRHQVEKVATKTWLMHSVTIDVEYAKSLLLQLQSVTEVPDLSQGLKDTMIYVACNARTATLRSRALKSISKMIKLRPESVLDEKIATVVTYRAADPSVVTRESALDLLSQFFRGLSTKSSSAMIACKEDIEKFTALYLRLIIERASDKSHLVRRKVIQLLTSILNQQSFKESTIILKVLVQKWQDSNLTVRENLVKCLGKIFISKLSKSGVDSALEFIGVLVGCQPLPPPYHLSLSGAMATISGDEGAFGEEDDVWAQVFSQRDVANTVAVFADELAQRAVSAFCSAEKPADKLEKARVLKTLSCRIAGNLIVILQILVPHLELQLEQPFPQDQQTIEKESQTMAKVQRVLCEALLPIVEYAYMEEDGDGLPLQQSQQLRKAAKKVLFSCPLVNLPTFIRLGEALDQPQLLETILQCANMVQTDIKDANKPINSRFLGRALMIIAYGVAVLPRDGLQAMEETIGIDLQKQIQTCFELVLERVFLGQDNTIAAASGTECQNEAQNGDYELFDVVLESLSQVWLTFPEVISATLGKEDFTLFDLIARSLHKSGEETETTETLSEGSRLPKEQLRLQPLTKSHIIVTLTRSISVTKSDQLVDFLRPMLTLIASKELEPRKAAADLFFELHNQGQIQLSEAINHLVALQTDSCQAVRSKALQHLMTIIRTKLKYFQSCFSPLQVITASFAHYAQIEPQNAFSGFVLTRRGNARDDFLIEERGVFDQLFVVLADEDSKVVSIFIQQMIGLIESTEFISTASVDLITFYSSFLLTLAKHADTKVKKVCQTLISTRELATYSRLKAHCQEIKSGLERAYCGQEQGAENNDDDDDQEKLSIADENIDDRGVADHRQSSSAMIVTDFSGSGTIENAIREAYFTIVLKMFSKLIDKEDKVVAMQGTDTNTVTQRRQKKATLFYRAVNKELSELPSLCLGGSPEETQKTAMKVREVLRERLKQKDIALRTQMAKKLDQIKSLPAKKQQRIKKKNAKRSPSSSQSRDKDVDESEYRFDMVPSSGMLQLPGSSQSLNQQRQKCHRRSKTRKTMPAVKSSGYDRFCRNEDDYSDDGCSSYDSYGYDNGDDDEEYKQ